MARFTEFDFGLTGLAGLFHQDWSYAGSVEDVVLLRLAVADPSPQSELLQRKEAAALRADVDRLAESALADDQVALLWRVATGGNYRAPEGESGRELLHRIGAACHQWQAAYGEVAPEDDPGWRGPEIMHRVREAIDNASLEFSGHSYFHWIFGAEDRQAITAQLRKALDLCAQSASPDVAFRLLLRVHLGLSLPVDSASWERYQHLAADFSYGEFLLSSLEYLAGGSEA